MKMTLLLLSLVFGASCAGTVGGPDELGDVEFAVRGEVTTPNRYTVKNTNDQLKVCGGGVLLFNEPGFYYMGRAFDGWAITAEAKYESVKSRSYLFGYVEGTVQACLWMGPPTTGSQPGQNLDAVYTTNNGRAADHCQRRFDALYDRATIGVDFNCEIHKADGGSLTKLTKDSNFYYNLQWRGDFMGGNPQDLATTLRAGQEVAYRYRTRDRRWAIVQVANHGWGFIDGDSVKYPGCSEIKHFGCPGSCGSTDAPCCEDNRCNQGLTCQSGTCKAPPMPEPPVPEPPPPLPVGVCAVRCIQCNKTNTSSGPVVNLGTITEQSCRASAPSTCTMSYTTWTDSSRIILEPRKYCGIRCKNNENSVQDQLTERECRLLYRFCENRGKTARIKWGDDYIYNADGC